MKFLILFSLIFSMLSPQLQGQTSTSRAATSLDLDSYYGMKADLPKYEANISHLNKLITEIDTDWNRFWSPKTTHKIIDGHRKEIQRLQKKIGDTKATLKSMEEHFIVKKWQANLEGFLKLAETKLGSIAPVASCPTKKDGEYQFFENDFTFETWNKGKGNEGRMIAYYAGKDPYISKCLLETGEGASTTIDRFKRILCKWPNTYYNRTLMKYTLKKSQGQIIISTSINFNYKGDPKKKAESFQHVKNSFPCVKKFFARHGLKLDLRIEDQAGKDHKSCHHEINLHNESKRMNVLNWATHKDQGVDLSDGARCTIYIHELSHSLGLRDMYPDPDCPDRSTIGASDDIMRTVHTDVNSLKFYPYAIKSILGPLCEK